MNYGLGEFVASLLFPTRCCGCEQEGQWYCQSCFNQTPVLPENRCAICKKAATNGLCDVCRTKTSLDGVVALFDYQQSAIREIIQNKYRGNYAAIAFVSHLCARRIHRRLPEDVTYSFVPQNPAQAQSRGFNASELIATTVAGASPIFRSIKKVKETPHQAGLDRANRLKNLVGAFEVPKGITAPESVAICDDLITTGTTLSRVARLLRSRGSKCIWGVTIAHD